MTAFLRSAAIFVLVVRRYRLNPIRYVEARVNENASGGRGATTGGIPDAWADSIREVTAFFARSLRNEAR